MKKVTKILSAVVALALVAATVQLMPACATSNKESTEQKLGKAMVLYVGSPTAYVRNSEKRVDPDNPEVVPYLEEGRTLIPVRFIAESLGLEVEWEQAASRVTIREGQKKVKMVLGSNIMSVENREIKLEAPAKSVNNRTFVPLRALVEALGKEVFYDRGLIVISDNKDIFNANSDKTVLDGIIAKVNKPAVVGSREALASLLDKAYNSYRGGYELMDAMPSATGAQKEKRNETVKAEASMDNAKAAEQKSTSDYSKTNVQVEGVDEADVVKTDGEYIYQVNRQRIVIAKAYPAESLEVASVVNFEGKSFSPREIYIDEKHMVVIGTTYSQIPIYNPEAGNIDRWPPPYEFNGTKAVIFDIADKKNVKQTREVELEGDYLSSRKIGSTLYLISSKSIWRWGIPRIYDEKSVNDALNSELKGYDRESVKKYADLTVLPSFRDTAAGNDYTQVDYSRIHFFPGVIQANYMNVGVVNLDKNEKAAVLTYLGAGQNVYASEQNLYVAVTNYNKEQDAPGIQRKILPMGGRDTNTLVYKFSLTADTVTYLSKGEVPGTILNQFSMDEWAKTFRIATTKGDVWRSDELTSQNNVYILDEMLNITGRLENLAPGEKIYSVRFMGDRGYIVTFKTIDPLFVIDLKDPAKPKVLGALKIPGYSDYLHPYDENHIIGFGKDTVEIKGRAYYLGMKMAIFDVRDVANPKELFVEKIGDRGTESELLRNHKALLFSKEKNLLAFPVTLMEVKGGERIKEEFPQYGQFTYQGAYVYNIDLTGGFKLKGRITHLLAEDYAKAGNHWYDSDKNVERILYIGDTLYTLSQSMIKANGMGDLKEKKALNIQ